MPLGLVTVTRGYWDSFDRLNTGPKEFHDAHKKKIKKKVWWLGMSVKSVLLFELLVFGGLVIEQNWVRDCSADARRLFLVSEMAVGSLVVWLLLFRRELGSSVSSLVL